MKGLPFVHKKMGYLIDLWDFVYVLDLGPLFKLRIENISSCFVMCRSVSYVFEWREIFNFNEVQFS